MIYRDLPILNPIEVNSKCRLGLKLNSDSCKLPLICNSLDDIISRKYDNKKVDQDEVFYCKDMLHFFLESPKYITYQKSIGRYREKVNSLTTSPPKSRISCSEIRLDKLNEMLRCLFSVDVSCRRYMYTPIIWLLSASLQKRPTWSWIFLFLSGRLRNSTT